MGSQAAGNKSDSGSWDAYFKKIKGILEVKWNTERGQKDIVEFLQCRGNNTGIQKKVDR